MRHSSSGLQCTGLREQAAAQAALERALSLEEEVERRARVAAGALSACEESPVAPLAIFLAAVEQEAADHHRSDAVRG